MRETGTAVVPAALVFSSVRAGARGRGGTTTREEERGWVKFRAAS